MEEAEAGPSEEGDRRKRVKWDGQSFAGQLEVTFPGGPDPEKRFGLPIPWLSADPALLFIGEVTAPKGRRRDPETLQITSDGI